ncbi:hypothetical protein [Desulfosporosinus sp. FKA]|uniref:hypothetical protein n=1 Tax=Desulfosporosinus sp. FKA TaxID=1969834 RepID=UPI000B49DB66|nr:hypothetical protein [Desulfosporosinus sp. FKA]
MLLGMNLQKFAQDRVLGSSVTIDFYLPTGVLTISELDSFKSDRKSTQKKFQPLGQVGQRTQDIPGDWEMTFSGGVVDESFDSIVDQIEAAGRSGQTNIRVVVKETTIYYSGLVKTWVWNDTVLYNFAKDEQTAADEIKWSFSGAATTRVPG